MKARTQLVAVACINSGDQHTQKPRMPANCEAQTMKQVQQAYTPLAGLSDSDSYVVMFGVGWALAFQWPPRAFRRIAWSSACRGHGQPWVIGVYCYGIGLADDWLSLFNWILQMFTDFTNEQCELHWLPFCFYFCASSSSICQFASASLTTRRGVVNAILCRRLVHHGRAVICLCTTAKRGGSTSLGSTCEIPMVLNCVSCVSMLAPFSESGALVFPTWLSVAVRGPANSSALVERVHQIRVIGFALAGLCHLYKPISIIWILYNSPRHNDQLRKEWWISSNFELWFLKRIQKLLVMRTTLGSPSAQGHCEAVIALRSRLSHALVSEDPIKKAHGMSRTGNSYWNGKHLHRNQDGVTSLLIDIQLGGPLEAMIPRCRHPFHNGSLRIFSVWKWYQLMIGWCRQTKVKMFQWMIDEKRQVYKRL